MKKRKYAIYLVMEEDKDGAVMVVPNLTKKVAPRLCEKLNDVLEAEDGIIDEVYFTVRKETQYGRL